jgi:hypothetical protein
VSVRDVLTLLLVVLAVGLFAGLWSYLLWRTWKATTPPTLDPLTIALNVQDKV